MKDFEKSWSLIDPEYVTKLKSEIVLLNISRMKMFLESILVLQLLTYLILFVISGVSSVYTFEYSGSLTLFFALLVFSVIEYVWVTHQKKGFLSRRITAETINNNLLIIVGFITTWGALLSVCLSGNDAVDNVYLLSLMVTSFMFYMEEKSQGIIFVISSMFYLVGHIFFAESSLQVMDYLNLGVFIALSWVVGRMNYQSYLGFHKDQCIIHDKNNLLQEVNADLTNEVMEKQEIMRDLESANAMLRKISAIDELTGVPNRRKLNEVVLYEWRRSQRERNDIAIFMIDIDNFKSYNDIYGHVAGDVVLRKVATALNRFSMRPTDFFGRYGGEEFTFLAVNMSKDNILHFANRMRAAVEGLKIEHTIDGKPSYLTISIGSTLAKPYCGDEVDKAFKRSDMALYMGKHDGKNTMRFLDLDDEVRCRKG
ncbi:MAG: GGDEF domain-containing protein [Clostridia bacterium]|nr:GGDEF domain-containing protein [Clostridia bacterium]